MADGSGEDVSGADGCCPVDLSTFDRLDGEARRRALVAETARFATCFARWMETRGAAGLTYPRLRVLQVLAARGPVMMRELADQLGMSARAMTAVVDILVENGHVERHPHPTDRRATLVALTPAGRATVRESLGPVLDSMVRLFDGMDAEDERAFLLGLHRLREAMHLASG